jgi:peptidoglycan/xylan/chitin deacetylase (PgdA/CDA1 family)
VIKNAAFLIFFVGYSVFANEVCKNVDSSPLFDEIRAEIKSCHPHDVHLTFDDGPSLIATEKILEGLKKRNAKATFFISTTNLEKGSQLQDLVLKEIEEGHTVGDHGYEHNAYDLRIVGGKVEDKGYSELDANKQIKKSINLLDKATNGKFSEQNIKMFRFPYGRGAMPSPDELNYMEEHNEITFRSKKYFERLREYRQTSHAVAEISSKGFSHLGWNHDSEDFKYGVSSASELNVKDFVKENLKRMCASNELSQVALFHDIKSINVKAIPLIIDVGRCMGLSFVSSQELIHKSEQLIKSGVLIPKDSQLKGTAKFPNDVLDIIVQNISGHKCEVLSPPTYNNCKSSNGRIYKHCEGEDSICINGEWESRAKTILDGKCNLAN